MWNWRNILIKGITLFVVAGMGYFTLRYGKYKSSAQNERLKEISTADIKQIISEHPLTLVNAWASWCVPCQAEFPDVLKIRKDYGSKGLYVVFLSLDSSGDVAAAEQFLKAQNVDFLTYRALSAGQIQELNPDWQGAIPSSFLYDKTGKRLEFWQGETHFTQFKSKLDLHF